MFTERVFVRRRRLCPRLWCLYGCWFVPCGVKGGLVSGTPHTHHPSVERLGDVDASVVAVALLHAWRGLQHVRLRSHGYSAADCSLRTRLPAEEMQWIGDVAGILSWFSAGEPLRTAFIRVLRGSELRLRDLVNSRPTCGRPPSATFGSRPCRSGNWPRRNGAAYRASTPGLAAQDEVAEAAPLPRGGVGFGGPQADDVGDASSRSFRTRGARAS